MAQHFGVTKKTYEKMEGQLVYAKIERLIELYEMSGWSAEKFIAELKEDAFNASVRLYG